MMSDENYARTDPRRMAVLCIQRAAETIRSAEQNTALWFLAIPELHRAVYSALVAALTGTHGTGAYARRDRRGSPGWLQGDQDMSSPNSQWVDTFENLLARAQQTTAVADLGGEPLKLAGQICRDLRKLNELRDDIEHVKPGGWSLEVGGLPRIANSAVVALRHLFSCSSIRIHLSEAEIQAAEGAFRTIEEIAKLYPSEPPKSWQSNQD